MQNQAIVQNVTKHLHDNLKVIWDNQDQFLVYSDALLSPKHILYSAHDNMFFCKWKGLTNRPEPYHDQG